MTPRDRPDDEARWQAFRYVADELGPDDRAAFEARLGDDPAACAAVAEAVELLGACLALDPPSAVGRRRRWARVGATVALAAAAAVALAILPPDEEAAGPADVPATIALEDAWSHLQRSETVDDVPGPADEAPDPGFEGWEAGSLAFAAEEAPPGGDLGGPDPPSWLIAAVALDGGAAEGPQHPLEN